MPDGAKTDTVREMELYLRDMLRQVDSSLLDEWEKHARPGLPAVGRGRGRPAAARPEEPPDVTRDPAAFTAAIRTRIFAFLRAWSIGGDEAALEALDSPATATRRPGRPSACARHAKPTASSTRRLRLDPEARNLRHTYVHPADDRRSGACSRCSWTRRA